MKTMFLTLSLLMAGVTANASSFATFSDKETYLLTKVGQSCSKEFASIMSPSRYVLSAEEVGGMAPNGLIETTTIVVGMRQFGFGDHPLQVLTMQRVANNEDQIKAPDAPMIWKSTCTIEAASSAKSK